MICSSTLKLLGNIKDLIYKHISKCMEILDFHNNPFKEQINFLFPEQFNQQLIVHIGENEKSKHFPKCVSIL